MRLANLVRGVYSALRDKTSGYRIQATCVDVVVRDERTVAPCLVVALVLSGVGLPIVTFKRG